MAQIANQDHLYVQIEVLTAMSADEKALLKQKGKEGTLLDVVLTDGTQVTKIIGYELDENGDVASVTFAAEGNLAYVEF